ncbi:TetR/AcrR family transcriptional regulator [Clostridium sp. 19966]|uniref:TetR/AcrR family transcriptional regulator n=1 Tax=Clostridium sp. 19966 TaxID=2768166 RepID=UPI0028DF0AEE|nr:TetR/AcrR family transcriptional regulator [Clostridium sp. 19966]MDT8718770.1 TetR/AcrR family transcriptional regulator [Clostridium sp. 19966]
MDRKTRKPTQKRSLEKYEKIIDAAFKLFNEKGYYNITTADIAKEADVATGSVYSYFVDKKDIYIEIIKRISKNIFEPSSDFWLQKGKLNFKDEENIKSLFKTFVKLMIGYHNFSKLFHDEMTALELLDEDIAAIKKENYEARTEGIRNIFKIMSIPFKSEEASDIFMHYCNLLIEDVCHQILYDKTTKNVDHYIEQVVDMLYKLLENLADI